MHPLLSASYWRFSPDIHNRGQAAKPGLAFTNIGVTVAIFASALSFGAAYGTGDQSTYLIHGLLTFHPNAIPGDWFANTTVLYHGTWLWGLLTLMALDLSPEVLALLNVLVVATSLWLVCRIATRLAPRFRVPVLLLTMALVVGSGVRSVGGSWMFGSLLTPQSIAQCLMLGAIDALLGRRLWLSGALLGASGYFHLNVLLLSFPLFGLAHLILGAGDLRSDPLGFAMRLVRQFWLATVMVALRIPLILQVAGGPAARKALDILAHVRAPHHYDTFTFLPRFIQLGGWCLLGLAGLMILRPGASQAARRVGALWASLLVMLSIALVGTTILPIAIVTRSYVWRFAPLLQLLSQVIAIAAAGRLASRRWTGRPRRFVMAALLGVIGAVVVLRMSVYHSGVTSKSTLLTVLVFAAMAALAATRVLNHSSRRRSRAMAVIATAVVLAVCLVARVDRFARETSLVTPPHTKMQRQLYDWASKTPPSTRFLVPPEMENFRLQTRRAIVADWKSIPRDPAGLLEWHQRMQDISGGPAPTLSQASADYTAQSLGQLGRTARAYECGFIVTARAARGPVATSTPVVFENDDYVVYRCAE